MTTCILVLDKYDDPYRWVYSAQAASVEGLRNLECYEDPPDSDSREGYRIVSQESTSKRRCGAVVPDPGTIYELEYV